MRSSCIWQSQHPHGHVIMIWAFGKWFTLTIVAVYHSHVIFPASFPETKWMGKLEFTSHAVKSLSQQLCTHTTSWQSSMHPYHLRALFTSLVVLRPCHPTYLHTPVHASQTGLSHTLRTSPSLALEPCLPSYLRTLPEILCACVTPLLPLAYCPWAAHPPLPLSTWQQPFISLVDCLRAAWDMQLSAGFPNVFGCWKSIGSCEKIRA